MAIVASVLWFVCACLMFPVMKCLEDDLDSYSVEFIDFRDRSPEPAEQPVEEGGSENRGANESVISSLPTSRVARDSTISEPCSICLQDFQEGDTRKLLQCAHGFHAQCIDQWLHTNLSCPICKHSVS